MENKIRILIVEDKPLIAENLRMTLEDLGYEVAATCYTFASATAAMGKEPFDLALLDINLGSDNPDENGIVLARLITAASKAPFIFLTAYNDLETIRAATKLGPSGYLIKPVNPATVFAAIQAAIERHRLYPTALADEEAQPDYFFLKLGDRNHRIMWKEVYCIEAGKNYVKLRIAGGRMEYPIRGSITFVLDELLPKHLQKQFLRISRSECLNRAYITSYDTDSVTCEGRKYVNTRFTLKELQELMRMTA